MKYGYIITALAIICFSSCDQGEEPPFGRFGTTVKFSGYNWEVKVHENQVWGPGPNYFSGNSEDIFLDDNGYLHMRIAQRDDRWFSTEVVNGTPMGYGTYTWTIEGDFVNIPADVVVGLFTWDNDTFFEHANSEVDIEFAKWGNVNTDKTLQYGVQPIAFGGFNAERAHKPVVGEDIIGVSTHQFIWTDSLITWKSFTGESANPENQIAEWSFDDTNPARIKFEGGQQSEPIVIPGPGQNTNARINFWLLNNQNGPMGGEPLELVVRSFSYSES